MLLRSPSIQNDVLRFAWPISECSFRIEEYSIYNLNTVVVCFLVDNSQMLLGILSDDVIRRSHAMERGVPNAKLTCA